MRLQCSTLRTLTSWIAGCRILPTSMVILLQTLAKSRWVMFGTRGRPFPSHTQMDGVLLKTRRGAVQGANFEGDVCVVNAAIPCLLPLPSAELQHCVCLVTFSPSPCVHPGLCCPGCAGRLHLQQVCERISATWWHTCGHCSGQL